MQLLQSAQKKEHYLQSQAVTIAVDFQISTKKDGDWLSIFNFIALSLTKHCQAGVGSPLSSCQKLALTLKV